MGDLYAHYIKQVGRALDLPRRQKKELLNGFRAELTERFSESLDAEGLLSNVGQPEEVASALLEAVDVKEYTRFNSVRFRWFRITVAALVLIAMIAVGTIIYLDSTEVKRVEVRIIQESTSTFYSTNADESLKVWRSIL